MKTVDLRKKSTDELKDHLMSLLKSQFALRMKSAETVEKPHEFKAIRRAISRVKTVMTEKQENRDE